MTIRRFLFALLVLIVVVVQVYPLVWVFLTSLKTPAEFASQNPFSLPHRLVLSNYSRAIHHATLGLYFLNSFIVTATSVLFIAFLSAMAGYAIRLIGFKLSGLVLAVFLAGIVVPVQVVLIPLFTMYKTFGILNTRLSLILPMIGFSLPISVYIFDGFYRMVPRELIEASIIDGCDTYKTFFRIVFPMSRNTFTTVIVVNSVFIWNDFIFANTFVTSEIIKTIPLGLQNYIGEMGATDWTATFSAVGLSILPILVVYFALNKTVINAMTAGALKG